MTDLATTRVQATDVYGPEKRSAVMRRVKGRGTGPEIAVRRLIWRLGGRYRLNRADLPGKPDIVLAGRRLAIFVHGCFWHGHDCARGARVPKANKAYWIAKVARNRARDVATRTALTALRWRVDLGVRAQGRAGARGQGAGLAGTAGAEAGRRGGGLMAGIPGGSLAEKA